MTTKATVELELLVDMVEYLVDEYGHLEHGTTYGAAHKCRRKTGTFCDECRVVYNAYWVESSRRRKALAAAN